MEGLAIDTVLAALIMGIVQGLTEFLPVSSSGHLVIVPYLFGWDDPFITSLGFSVMLHLGTLVAVLIYFRRDFLAMARAIPRALQSPRALIATAPDNEIDRNAKGWFIPVTLVDNPPDHARIVTEEPFGPILPVLKWQDEADVIRRANDTVYGLGASVWGADLEAGQRIGAQLDAGTVWLNEIHQYSPHQAFGGHKQSGIGCENSLHGLMEYTNWHTITLNKKPAFCSA